MKDEPPDENCARRRREFRCMFDRLPHLKGPCDFCARLFPPGAPGLRDHPRRMEEAAKQGELELLARNDAI